MLDHETPEKEPQTGEVLHKENHILGQIAAAAMGAIVATINSDHGAVMASTPQEVPSLRNIQQALGITRYNIRPHITALIDNPESEIVAPQKVRIATLEALLIDEVWKNIRQWISDHENVRGLAHSNIPVMLPGTFTPASEGRFPQHSEDAHIWALTPEEYADNAHFSYQKFTLDVMQFHLLQWELRIKERLTEKGSPEFPDEIWYTKYISEVSADRPMLAAFKNIATTKMYFGFGFGQSMFWRMPDSSHETVMPKLGHLHLIMIETIEEILRQRGESASLRNTGRHSVLSAEFLRELHGRSEEMQQRLSSVNEQDNTHCEAIATGCPAVHTASFVETGAWIRDIRADQRRILEIPSHCV